MYHESDMPIYSLWDLNGDTNYRSGKVGRITGDDIWILSQCICFRYSVPTVNLILEIQF